NITQVFTSRSTLEPMIERYGLYAAERRRGVSMDELVERMRTKDIRLTLNTSRNEITNGFFLAYRGPSPRSAHDVAEALAAKYVSNQTKAATEDATLTKEFFTEKLNQAKEQLDGIDKRRLDFMEGHLHSLPSGTQALIGQLAGLREEQKARIAEIGRLNDQVSANNKFIADLSKANQQQVDEFIAQMQDPKSTAAYAELVKRKAELESDYQQLALQFKPKAPEMKAVKSQIDSIQGQMDEMLEEHKRKVEDVRKRMEERVDPRLTSYRGLNAQLQGDM